MLYQLLLLPVILILAAVLPRVVGKDVRRKFDRLANRRTLSVCLIGLIAFLIAAGMSLAVHMPVPGAKDEFAYLLGADTFASGRLSNPTHPLWESFEGHHIFHQPTHQMKYPPGQSILLAAGQVLGHPAIGVWLGLSLAAAATCWMLYGWVPPRWALLGGILFLLNFKLIRFWGQMYWGGALPLLGGALVFGALPRVMRKPTIGPSACLAAGLAILANTRPYEGFVAALLAAGAMLVWLFSKHRPSLTQFGLKAALPITAILLLAGMWMGLYNTRVTGSPWKLPYQQYQEIYGGRSLTAVVLRGSENMREPTRTVPPKVSDEERQRRAALFAAEATDYRGKLFRNWMFYVGIIAAVPLLASASGLKNWRVWFPATCVAAVAAAVVMQDTRGHLHYMAPVGGLVFLLIVHGMRRLQLVGRFGRNLVPLIPAALLVCFLLGLRGFWQNPVELPWSLERARILKQMQETGGRHVLVVRYRPDHNYHQEWVYNRADIDAADVVWAHELSPEQNQKLVDYMSDRSIWLLEPDVQPPRLTLHTSPAKRSEDSDQ